MKSKKIWLLSMLSVLLSFVLVGCEPWIFSPSDDSNLPDNEVISVLKSFDDDLGVDYSNIKEDVFNWLNYAEYDYNNYDDGWYYDITWYTLSSTGVKVFPDVNKVFDGWYVHYVWDEIWGSAIDYSKDNILCSYFLSLEQEIPYELLNREWDYDDEEQQAEYNQKWSDFYDIASYSVELSCGFVPEWAIQFKDFNYYAEWMEPFWNAYFVWDYVNIFTPDGLEEHYIDVLKSDWDNYNFKWYDFEWKLEKSECVDWGKWDIHEYTISFDVNKFSYWDDGVRHEDGTAHYEWCADKENPKFLPWEEWTLRNFINKSWYKYSRDYDQNKVSYAISNMIGKYMLVNFYYVDDEDYDSYQSIMENSDDGFKVLYEWGWYDDITDEKCEELNQYDNNLMDMFFLKSCPRW